MQKRGSFRKLNHLRQLESRLRPLILHAEEAWFRHILEGHCDFFEKIGAAAQAQGYKPLLIHAENLLSFELLDSNHLQIVIGPKRPKGARIFHAQPSYLKGFWYLDPQGYYWNSSLVDQEFDPQWVDSNAAVGFFSELRDHVLRHNISKRAQDRQIPGGLAPADVAIFVQDIEKYRQSVHYLNTAEMITTACASVTGRVYIKPHPLQDAQSLCQLQTLCENIENAELSTASVHDLIAASAVVLSQNSAVGFEALLQRKPVLTCARTDYHHATLVCHTSKELQENLRRAAEAFTDFPFERYVYWFMGQQMLEPQRSDFPDRAWARLLKTA